MVLCQAIVRGHLARRRYLELKIEEREKKIEEMRKKDKAMKTEIENVRGSPTDKIPRKPSLEDVEER